MPWSSPAPSKSKGGFSTPVAKTVKITPLAPPVGVNQVDPLAAMDPTDAVFMYNLISYRYGLKTRQGFIPWCINVGGGSSKTIIPYTGSIFTKDRLFAATPNGIYDVSASSSAPPLKFTFAGGTSTNSGMGIWQAVTTLAGFYMAYCDEDNGYHLYTESSDSWAQVTGAQVTGVDPTTLVFVLAFKERLWFVQRNSSVAYYLPTGAITGAATAFNFGNKFKHGGTLQALYTWTIQGSTGPGSYLVAISSSGEILIYGGDDPSDSSNWQIVGSWYIGNVPVGRRIANNVGGDLYILSVSGIQPLNKIVQGNQTQIENIEISRKITPAIRAIMLATFQQPGWEVKLYPTQDSLIVMSPQQTNAGLTNIQFVQSLNNQGWSVFQSVPMLTGEVWRGNFYFGAPNGNQIVYTFSGDTDNQPFGGGQGTAIESLVLSAYSDFEEPGLYHHPEFVRPVFLSSQSPDYSVVVKFDYDISEIFLNGPSAPALGSLWDVALWDVGIWGQSLIPISPVSGVTGMGRAMGIQMTMATFSETTILRYDVMFTTGDAL